MSETIVVKGRTCIECGCPEIIDADDETQFMYCPHCSFETSRRKQLAAEARANELAAQLATAQAERDEARNVCEYWLHHARFLTGDYHKDSEYNLSVESLKAYKLQEGIEP